MRESGLAELLPSLPDMVWVGVSAGSSHVYFSAPGGQVFRVIDEN